MASNPIKRFSWLVWPEFQSCPVHRKKAGFLSFILIFPPTPTRILSRPPEGHVRSFIVSVSWCLRKEEAASHISGGFSRIGLKNIDLFCCC